MSKYDNWGQRELIAELESRDCAETKEKMELKMDTKDNAPYKKITIPMSERDCQDIMNGETFDWTFDYVDVHIELEE